MGKHLGPKWSDQYRGLVGLWRWSTREVIWNTYLANNYVPWTNTSDMAKTAEVNIWSAFFKKAKSANPEIEFTISMPSSKKTLLKEVVVDVYIYYACEKFCANTQSTNLGFTFDTISWNGAYRVLEKSFYLYVFLQFLLWKSLTIYGARWRNP